MKKAFNHILGKKQDLITRLQVKNLVLALGVTLGIIFLGIYLLNFTYPRRRNHQRKISITSSLAFFKTASPQNASTVLDKAIHSTGCNTPLTIPTGTTTNMGITSGKEQRTYLIFLPAHYSNREPHALILSFHGYASNDHIQEKISRFDVLAQHYNVIVVYPQGTTGILAARGWNTGLHPTLIANDVLYVSNLLNQLQSNLCINPQQIYATGFSNGGGFVAELACKLSNRIAAFAPLSGSYMTALASCRATRPVPIIEFHGTADKIVPYGGLSTLKELATQSWLGEWAKKNNCSPQPTITQQPNNITKYSWGSCQEGASIVHYKITGGKHVWPKPLFEQAVQGKIQYVTATSIIWDFFQHHSLKTT